MNQAIKLLTNNDSNTLPFGNSDTHAIVYFDDACHVISVNKVACQWLNITNFSQPLSLCDAYLKDNHILFCDRHLQKIAINDILLGNNQYPYIQLTTPEQKIWIQLERITLDKNGQILILSDITPLMEETLKLEKHAEEANMRDMVTRLYNRRYGMERLTQMHQYAKRYHATFTIGLIDIDHVKRINDTFGHSFGDQVIKDISSLVNHSFRETDLRVRYSGEEFLILMPETETAEAIYSIDRLRQKVSELKWPEMQRPVTISSGVISWQPNKSIEQLMFMAEARLSTAKRAGRNQVCGEI